MKRILPAFLLCLLVVALATACLNQSEPQKTLSTTEISVVEFEEFEKNWDKDAPKTAEVVFYGKTYEGEYQYSIEKTHFLHVADKYSGSGVSFSVIRETSQLESIMIIDKIDEGDKTPDECREIAEELAKQYIDLSQYTLSTKGDSLRAFHFVRMIGGVETSDFLSVVVRSSGEISYFYNYTSGKAENAFSNADPKEVGDLIERLSSSEAMKMIDNKVNAIYENCASWSIVNKRLVELENHELGWLI